MVAYWFALTFLNKIKSGYVVSERHEAFFCLRNAKCLCCSSAVVCSFSRTVRSKSLLLELGSANPSGVGKSGINPVVRPAL